MKHLRLMASLAAAVLFTGAASAADLAARPYTKAPTPVVAAAYDWSGFYLGLNGGGAWSRKCWDLAPQTINLNFIPPFTVGGPEGCHDVSGPTAGGQIGYRWQVSNWVFGLEAMGNWADLSGSNTSLVLPGATNRTRIDAIGLFTGHIGHSWKNFLLYVKGGVAVTSDRYEGIQTATGIVFDRATETRWGAAVGIGGEYSFTRNWSIALEYDHLFMGSRDVTFYSTVAPFGFSRRDRIRQDVDMVTARINYRFGGPVVAKY